MALEPISYRDYRLNLAAGVPQTIAVVGDYFQIISASSPVMLEFDEFSALTREKGMGGPGNYSTVRVTSVAAQTVVLALGRTNGMVPYDGRATVPGPVTATIVVPNLAVPLADVPVANGAATLIAAADAARLELLVGNPVGSGFSVRIGDSTVDATHGKELAPGQDAVLSGTNAWHAWGVGGSPTLNLLSLRKV